MSGLPGEDALSSAPSSRLRDRIADQIRRQGPIPFSRYMERCLYEPDLGYYSRPREQFGKAGDFYTSSDVHAVFGRLLSRQFQEMWRVLDSPARLDIIELGPGRGLFARDVLDWSAKYFPEFSQAMHYSLVEQSPHLRAKLHERLEEHLAAGKCQIFDSVEDALAVQSAPDLQTSPVPHVGDPPSPGFDLPPHGQNLIVFANEFFDALPVEVIDHRGAVRVGYRDGHFIESFVPPSAAENEFLDRYGVHPPEGERVEAPLTSLSWMDRIAAVFHHARGFLVAIDYGYTREEQLAGRHRDTVMTYRGHTAGAPPYDAPGEQDITAHVNFTALRSRGSDRGLDPVALVTQSQFLIGIGEENEFADAFQDCKLPQERAKVALQLKHLISPTGMGETFQVLLMSKNVEGARAAALAGLKLSH